MDFLLSEDQLTLAEGVRDYLAGTHGPEVLRRLDEQGNRDPAIWQGLVEMGLPGLLVPEDQGGLGLKLLDAALIAAECGRACLAEPLVDTAFVAVPWLMENGNTDDLAAIALGEKTVPLAHKVNDWVADGDGEKLKSVDPLRNLSALPADATDDPRLTALPVTGANIKNDHLEYAITWFSLALVWAIMTFFLIFRTTRQKDA